MRVAVKTLQGLWSLVKFRGVAGNGRVPSITGGRETRMQTVLKAWQQNWPGGFSARIKCLVELGACQPAVWGGTRFFPLGMWLNGTVPPVWGPGSIVTFLPSLLEPFCPLQNCPCPGRCRQRTEIGGQAAAGWKTCARESRAEQSRGMQLKLQYVLDHLASWKSPISHCPAN